MESIKIFIENWPTTNWVAQYTPIVIAAIAVIVSLYSAYLSRRSFDLSSRPYVWASSYGVVDQGKRHIDPVPQRVGYRVKNAPAKVLESLISVNLGDEQIFSHNEQNFVRFPDESSEWSFAIGQDSFESIMNKYDTSDQPLIRKVDVKYMALSGGRKYKYSLVQEYIKSENQWKDIGSQAS